MNTTKGFIGTTALLTGGAVLLGMLGGGYYLAHRGGMARTGVAEVYRPTTTVPATTLSADAQAGLIKMREEEKLARDVYSALYDVWGAEIFSNIASSEQQHTTAIQQMLARYGITDPVTNDARGVFTNPEFTKLYNTLVAQGSTSLAAGLTVGATIEDLDIKDLQDLVKVTNQQDIRMVYENLMRGSRNHMRSFTMQLRGVGGSYTAQYITASELQEILSTSQERGNGAGGAMMHGGQGGRGR